VTVVDDLARPCPVMRRPRSGPSGRWACAGAAEAIDRQPIDPEHVVRPNLGVLPGSVLFRRLSDPSAGRAVRAGACYSR
jgi:hypothetical protein